MGFAPINGLWLIPFIPAIYVAYYGLKLRGYLKGSR